MSGCFAGRKLIVATDNKMFSNHITKLTTSRRFLLYNISWVQPLKCVFSPLSFQEWITAARSRQVCSACHPTSATDSKCSYTICFQPAQVLPHHPSSMLPPQASCNCPSDLKRLPTKPKKKKKKSSYLLSNLVSSYT